MSYTDVVARVAQIHAEILTLPSAFTPPAVSTGSTASTPAASSSTAGSNSFTSALANAMSPTASAGAAATPAANAIAPTGLATGQPSTLPANATTMLTPTQQQFASRLATDTGMDTGVVSAWLLAEESGGAATSRQSANNNDWLNIGYTGNGTFGAGDSVWSNPVTAADATAGWLKGQNTIPGYGTASSGIQGILATAGQPPATQISALQNSGWAGSGYPDLPSLYQQVAG